ncbi:hypothetical protein BCV70DRAFT_198132 [Testicularia cyperi]|uniref:DH domain-containing protein n=1 Tax=Testicularia cyperi TaxID=1882483 RepID=A0A317XX29_9BASI|nr:hypothetical protein BCV70DRAFT_198132 [Testicularia cyperi]
MPPRGPARSPFAGIGAGYSAFPPSAPASPERPSSRLGLSGRTTPSFLRSSRHASPHRSEGLPRDHANPTTSTFHAMAATDTTFAVSGVSDSISRAYFYDVVQEGSSASTSTSRLFRAHYSASREGELEASSSVVSWLGETVVDHSGQVESSDADDWEMPRSSSGSSISAVGSSCTSSPSPAALQSVTRASADPQRFLARVQELIDTERSYVRRLDALHQRYAIPLRNLARDRDTAIIPLYEAQRLFGNIGEIAGANRAFLNDLESLQRQGKEALLTRLGDVLYQHMTCFSCYDEYFANFEKAKHIEQTVSKHRGFRDFADRTKYSISDIGNTGLRDLLMEPIQRIPRYKLLIEAMLKHLDLADPQRARLEQAITVASRIASCEADDKTKRAAVLWSFHRNVDAFPAGLISVHRQFIDCIDVDDFPLDMLGPSAAYSGAKTLHCTLFLFDDHIAIVKRAQPNCSGRKVVGLDDLGRLATQMKTYTEKSAHASSLAPGKKNELAFRGSISIMDVEALDLGGADFQLTLLRPPANVVGDKWVGRSVRHFMTLDNSAAAASTVSSRTRMGSGAFESDVSARLEKMRFLESLWRARALYKARDGRSYVRCHVIAASRNAVGADEDLSQQISGEMADTERVQALRQAEARKVVYYNVYNRRSYAAETSKASLAVHVNIDERADPLLLGPEGLPPYAVFEVVGHDELEAECVVRSRSKRGHELESASTLAVIPVSDVAIQLTTLSDTMDKAYASPVVQVQGYGTPGTPSGSSFRQRAKAAAGLESFGRARLFAGAVGGLQRGLSSSTKRSLPSDDHDAGITNPVTKRVSLDQDQLSTRYRQPPYQQVPQRQQQQPQQHASSTPTRRSVDLHRSTTSPEPVRTPKRRPVPIYTDSDAGSIAPTVVHSPMKDQTEMMETRSVEEARQAEDTRNPEQPDVAPEATLCNDRLAAHLDEGEARPRRHPPATPARTTSSAASKSQEARRRNEAVEQSLRLVKEEFRFLKCDVEFLQACAATAAGAAGTDVLTPRKRRAEAGVLGEIDVNIGTDAAVAALEDEVAKVKSRTDRLELLLGDLDQRWISTIRMHNRVMHEFTEATAALKEKQRERSSKTEAEAESKVVSRISANGNSEDSQGKVEVIKTNGVDPGSHLLKDQDATGVSVVEFDSLKMQISALKRKCELLATLESDGRLENTEIHKAFNEELDMLYENTQRPESEELALLRTEIKKVKAGHHELAIQNRQLNRDLELQKTQNAVYEEMLRKHGLL